jgi:hypothetical protein
MGCVGNIAEHDINLFWRGVAELGEQILMGFFSSDSSFLG